MSTAESTRLIDECQGPQSPRQCGRCGATKSTRELDRFRYLDNDDLAERPRVLNLCESCAVELADHDERYRTQLQPLADNEPWPGALEVCLGCRYRDGLECRSPLAKFNGGPGIHFPGVTLTSAVIEAFNPAVGRVTRQTIMTYSKARECGGRRPIG